MKTRYLANIGRSSKQRLAEGLLDPLSPDERAVVVPYYEYFDLCNEQVFLRMQARMGARGLTP